MNSVLGRLGKSRLLEWVIAYLAFIWLVVQIVAVLADVWMIDDISQRRIHVALAFGLPATAVLAWFHGERGKQQIARSELLVLSALFGVAALSIPSAGGTEPVTVIGIPPSVVFPFAVVTMLLIPAVLITVSVYNANHRVNDSAEMPKNQIFDHGEKELWQRLLSVRTFNQLNEVRQEIENRLTEKPDSPGLRRLADCVTDLSESRLSTVTPPDWDSTRDSADSPTDEKTDSLAGGVVLADDTLTLPANWDSTGYGEDPSADEETGPVAGTGDLARSIRPSWSALPKQIWRELRTRKVVTMLILLLVSIAVLLQIVKVSLNTLSLPAAGIRIVWLMIILGISVTIVITWYHGRTSST